MAMWNPQLEVSDITNDSNLSETIDDRENIPVVATTNSESAGKIPEHTLARAPLRATLEENERLRREVFDASSKTETLRYKVMELTKMQDKSVQQILDEYFALKENNYQLNARLSQLEDIERRSEENVEDMRRQLNTCRREKEAAENEMQALQVRIDDLVQELDSARHRPPYTLDDLKGDDTDWTLRSDTDNDQTARGDRDVTKTADSTCTRAARDVVQLEVQRESKTETLRYKVMELTKMQDKSVQQILDEYYALKENNYQLNPRISQLKDIEKNKTIDHIITIESSPQLDGKKSWIKKRGLSNFHKHFGPCVSMVESLSTVFCSHLRTKKDNSMIYLIICIIFSAIQSIILSTYSKKCSENIWKCLRILSICIALASAITLVAEKQLESFDVYTLICSILSSFLSLATYNFVKQQSCDSCGAEKEDEMAKLKEELEMTKREKDTTKFLLVDILKKYGELKKSTERSINISKCSRDELMGEVKNVHSRLVELREANRHLREMCNTLRDYIETL